MHILTTNQCSSINQFFDVVIEITKLSRRIFSNTQKKRRNVFGHDVWNGISPQKPLHPRLLGVTYKPLRNRKFTVWCEHMFKKLLSFWLRLMAFSWDFPWAGDPKVTSNIHRWRQRVHGGGWFNDNLPPPWSSKKLRAGTGLAEKQQVSWCVKLMWVTGP